MKVEIVSNFEDPAGLVTGTLTSDAGRAPSPPPARGSAILTEFPVLSDPETDRAVRPSDGDVYLQALLSTLPDGYVFARIADPVTPEVIPTGDKRDTGRRGRGLS